MLSRPDPVNSLVGIVQRLRSARSATSPRDSRPDDFASDATAAADEAAALEADSSCDELVEVFEVMRSLTRRISEPDES